MSAYGYKQTSKTPSSGVRFAPNIGHSGVLGAFSATNFKLRHDRRMRSLAKAARQPDCDVWAGPGTRS